MAKRSRPIYKTIRIIIGWHHYCKNCKARFKATRWDAQSCSDSVCQAASGKGGK